MICPVSARGMTRPIIQNKKGHDYVTTMNVNDLSELDDKIEGLIHEMRHDMSNYNKKVRNAIARWDIQTIKKETIFVSSPICNIL